MASCRRRLQSGGGRAALPRALGGAGHYYNLSEATFAYDDDDDDDFFSREHALHESAAAPAARFR